MKALIIGGKGKMGRWFAKFLSSKGFEVLINDPAGPLEDYGFVDDFRKALDSELIILATPISKTNNLLSKLLNLETRALIFDICSLKKPIKETLIKVAGKGKKIVSIHPMLGPEDNLSGKNILVCTCGNDLAVKEARRLFEGENANLVNIELEEHDKLMSYVLGLSHAINITFSKTLSDSGLSLKDLARVAGPSFDAQLKLAERVIEQSEELCYELQALNPHTKKVLAKFSESFVELKNLIDKKDSANFIKIMQKSKKFKE